MEELYAKYNRLMFAIAWRYTKDPHEVADIVSNSCLKLMKNLATLKTLGAQQQKTYIVQTVKHTAFNEQKKNTFWRAHSISMNAEAVHQVPGVENVEKTIELKEKLAFVLRVIDSLPQKERLMLTLRFQAGKDCKEIASIVGLSEESIHKYISRARKKIKAALSKEEENHEQ